MFLKGILYDFVWTLYNPEEGRLFDGVLPMLERFKASGVKQGLVTFGSAGKEQLLDSLGLKGILDWYRVVDQKTADVFLSFLRQFNLREEEVLVVGDLLEQEIALGKSLGMKTAWISPEPGGDFRDLADYVLPSVAGLTAVITTEAPDKSDVLK